MLSTFALLSVGLDGVGGEVGAMAQPSSLSGGAGMLERASELRRAPTVAEAERPAAGGWRGLFEVPFALVGTERVPQPSEDEAYGGPTRLWP
jgi:hypothetical protein